MTDLGHRGNVSTGPITELIREWIIRHPTIRETIGSTDGLGVFIKINDVHIALKDVTTIYPDGRRMIVGDDVEISLHAIDPCGIFKMEHLKYKQVFFSMLWFPDPEVMELEWREITQRYEQYWLTNGITE